MKLTERQLAGAYIALRTFPPFCEWDLPDDVRFSVCKTSSLMGAYQRELRPRKPPIHSIAISAGTVGKFHTLCRIMAHEMVHLYQGVKRTDSSGSEHNAEFRRLAAQVCEEFGWDVKEFV